jgi:uncharacterized Zn finger protein
MITKAYDLIQKKKVERLSEGTYNVVGEHGTYTVGRKLDGTVSCTCPGFARRGRCSHALAVMMLNNPALLRSIEKEARKAMAHGESGHTQR